MDFPHAVPGSSGSRLILNAIHDNSVHPANRRIFCAFGQLVRLGRILRRRQSLKRDQLRQGLREKLCVVGVDRQRLLIGANNRNRDDGSNVLSIFLELEEGIDRRHLGWLRRHHLRLLLRHGILCKNSRGRLQLRRGFGLIRFRRKYVRNVDGITDTRRRLNWEGQALVGNDEVGGSFKTFGKNGFILMNDPFPFRSDGNGFRFRLECRVFWFHFREFRVCCSVDCVGVHQFLGFAHF